MTKYTNPPQFPPMPLRELDLLFHDLISKMAPKVQLMYFDIRARAEIVRIMLNYGGIEFEDKRIQNADWPMVKPSMLYRLEQLKTVP